MKINGAFSGYSSDKIEESRSFYAETLGLDVVDAMGGLKVTVNGQQIFIYPKEDHQPATFTVLNLVVDDIDSAVDDLVGSGVQFEWYDNLPATQDKRGVLRGKDAGMGPNIAWFKDPADNIVALVEE